MGGESATVVEAALTMRRTPAVLFPKPTATGTTGKPLRGEDNTVHSGVRSCRSTTLHRKGVPPPPLPEGCKLSGESSLPLDSSRESRLKKESGVREKFNDVFKVSNCNIFEESFFDSVTDDVSVAGRLSQPSSIEFFESIGASEFVLNTLRRGHHPRLMSSVPSFERKNNGSFFKHLDFATSEIRKLIDSNRVELVSSKPHLVLPLHVVVQPKKNRLILDCTYLNQYILVPKIKFEDYKVVLNYFCCKGYIFAFDFKDGYYHLKIHPDFKKFLGFSLVLDGKKVYGQFKVGFLGLADLPFIFTKVFRVLIKHWRAHDMSICLYLDDGFHFHPDFDVSLKNSRHVRSDLYKAGVVWSIKKSTWQPCLLVEWLGMIWDADQVTLKIADRRISKLRDTISILRGSSFMKVRKLASFVGQVISLAPVVGSVSSLLTRFSQVSIASSDSYDAILELSSEISFELEFWDSQVHKLNVRSCVISKPPVALKIFGDASATGCGSFIVNSDLVAARSFTVSEREAHSTWRELENVHFTVKSFLSQLRGRCVKFFVDNESSVRIINNGSMKPACHQFALEIFKTCFDNSISLNMEWVPRGENKLADAISRLSDVIDTDDWGISKEFFKLLDTRFGPFTLDCFANFYNAKLPKFYSMFFVPGTSGVDSFCFNWAGEVCLLVPPVAVVGRCLEHLFRCRAKGVLVVPLWPSSFFWPMLKGFFSQFIVGFLRVKGSKVLVLGRNLNSLLGSINFKSEVLAIHLDCSLSGD